MTCNGDGRYPCENTEPAHEHSLAELQQQERLRKIEREYEARMLPLRVEQWLHTQAPE